MGKNQKPFDEVSLSEWRQLQRGRCVIMPSGFATIPSVDTHGAIRQSFIGELEVLPPVPRLVFDDDTGSHNDTESVPTNPGQYNNSLSSEAEGASTVARRIILKSLDTAQRRWHVKTIYRM